MRDRLMATAEFQAIASQQQGQITQRFEQFLSFLSQQRLIALIRDRLRTFEERD